MRCQDRPASTTEVSSAQEICNLFALFIFVSFNVGEKIRTFLTKMVNHPTIKARKNQRINTHLMQKCPCQQRAHLLGQPRHGRWHHRATVS